MRQLFSRKNVLVVTTALFWASILFFSLYIYGDRIVSRVDFANYLTGAHIVKNGLVKNLYDTDVQWVTQTHLANYIFDESIFGYRALPIVAVLYIPFALVPSTTAFTIFFILNAVLFFAFWLFLFKYFDAGLRLYLVPFFISVLINLISGQPLSVLLWAFLAIYLCLKKEKYFAAGLFTAFLFLKVQYISMIPLLFFSVKNKKDFFKGAFFVCLFMLVSNFLIYGPQLFTHYPFFLVQSEDAGLGTDIYANFNLFSFLKITKDFIPHSLRFLAVAISTFGLYVLVCALLSHYGKRLSLESLYSVVVIFTLLLNFHTMPGDTTLLLIPFLLLGKSSEKLHQIFSWLIYFVVTVGMFQLIPYATFILLFIGFYILVGSFLVANRHSRSYCTPAD